MMSSDWIGYLLLMEVNGLNLVHCSLQVCLCVQHLVCGNVAHLEERRHEHHCKMVQFYLDVVRQEPEEDGLGCVSHVALSSEGCLL